MTHTQLHSLHGQTEAMTRQNYKCSHKLVMNAQPQHLSNGKRSDKILGKDSIKLNENKTIV